MFAGYCWVCCAIIADDLFARDKVTADQNANVKKVLPEGKKSAWNWYSNPVKLSVDASTSSLGAVRLQDGFPVAYTSQALKEAKTLYAQI